jgi:hypothetical protein
MVFLGLISSLLLIGAGASAALVGLWDFESAATPFADASGNGYDATAYGSPSRVTAPADVRVGSGALRLDPAGLQYLQLPDMTAQFAGQSATLAFWIKLDEAVPSAMEHTGLESFGSLSIAPYPASHYPWIDSRAYLTTFRGTSRVDGIALLPGVDRASWHHVAITTTPGTGTWRLYQDGMLVTTADGDWFLNSMPVFGRSEHAGNFYWFSGYVDDLRLYNEALSQAEIQALIVPEPAAALPLAVLTVALVHRRRWRSRAAP